MKIIDLLNKIANGEKVAKKIKYREMIYHICYECGDYESDIEEYRFADTKEHYYLFEDIDMLKCLNDEVEIIEEDKKIEHKKGYFDFAISSDDVKFSYLYKMETRIMDKINEMEDKRER